nr:myosin-binding protein 3-like [Nicotiana tomentosiformis]
MRYGFPKFVHRRCFRVNHSVKDDALLSQFNGKTRGMTPRRLKLRSYYGNAGDANQAMAMITRLREEKATLEMETLQCLMEEQAECDSEALQKANDLHVR